MPIQIFNILESLLKFSLKKYSLALHIVYINRNRSGTWSRLAGPGCLMRICIMLFSLWCGSRSFLSLWCGSGSVSYLSIWCGSGSYHSLYPRFGPSNASKWPSKASTFPPCCGSGSTTLLDANPDPDLYLPKWYQSGRIWIHNTEKCKILILLIYLLHTNLGSWCEMTFWRAMSQSMVCLGTRSVRLLAIQWNSIRPFLSSTFAASSLKEQANNSHWSIKLAL